MEGVTIDKAKLILGNNFVGLEELRPLFEKMQLSYATVQVPVIQYSYDQLQRYSNDYLLILGIPELDNVPLSIQTFRNIFGVNPELSEPCFYNQDWYLNEDFINKTLDLRWYLLKKNVWKESRAIQPNELLKNNVIFPNAILCVYAFWAYYYAQHVMLWYYDFIWCNDTDHNGDRIYVGKYHDIDGVNKDGFSIHRHLALRSCYGAIATL